MTAQPVLIGPVPLLYVQSVSMTEGYQIQRIADSKFSQAIAPTRKAIAIEAMLLGPDRLVTKKALEVLALNSRLLVAATATTLAVTGIPVVCGLTISLDMQITDLRFTQSVQKRDAIDVSISLEHVPRGTASALAGEIADLALAAGSAVFGGAATPAAVPAVPSVPL
ncbi:hypothetical protein [Nocardia pseudobrasiliensis]|uniref:Uncharacterized protein n=1 Tax=Nocardia pseudobrasiliensis TaxID=45979 RepID=A0A370IBT5_9NOCA|nr:hypothetical protein [Nocardia pseudobrasiliensis]RDI68167.1 hypothetical protein DFR76_102568 [Nocardia pseudobrasiliensis]